MADFLITPIWLPHFEETVCCHQGRTEARSEGSGVGWDDDDPAFDWLFGLQTPTVWNRLIQFGVCCHREIQIDVHYKALESATFDGVFTIKVEDADGERTVFDAALKALPSEGGTFDETVTVALQPQPCGIIVTLEGEITATLNSTGEPNEGTFFIKAIRLT